MILTCPWCGPRNIGEFAWLGESRVRPDPENATPEQWRAYLYLRENRAGVVSESWLHRAGCRRVLDARRDTRTNEVLDTSPPRRAS
jgi:heterotetrameric sarcosine oxidase delta subunit